MVRSTRHPSPIRRPIEGPSAEMIPQVVPHEEIARRAYQLFVERGGAHGHDVDDWFQAEREILLEVWRE